MANFDILTELEGKRRYPPPKSLVPDITSYICPLCKCLLELEEPQQCDCGDRACKSCAIAFQKILRK